MVVATARVLSSERIGKIDAFLARALITDVQWHVSWSEDVDQQAAVVERLLYHGIAALLTFRADALRDWPEPVLEAMRRQALAQAMWEARHVAILRNLLASLVARGIHPLLLKGTAMAYDLYDFPAQRSRGDTDLLVDANEMHLAHAALQASGFVQDKNSADNVNPFCVEELWIFTAPDGYSHMLDLHPQVLNSRVHADILPVAEMRSGNRKLSTLSPHALAPSHVSALLHTCVHRAQHIVSPYWVDGQSYAGGNRLVWLMDIHLLAGALSHAEWEEFCCRAEHKGLAALCLDGLDAAAQRLETFIPDHVRQRLASSTHRSPLYAKYMGGSFNRMLMEIRAQSGLRNRVVFLLRAVFPPRRYMRDKYPEAVAWPVFTLYFRRLIVGGFRHLRGR